MASDQMSEEQAHEMLSRMMGEIGRTMNGVGDYPESEDETASEDEVQDSSNATLATPKQTDADGQAAPPDVPKKKKKRKKKKAADKPDLEELLYNAEALPPEDPFDITKSAAERVEIAVTRFRKNRKFSSERAQILSVYLDFGGIRTGPKSFQGGAVRNPGFNDDGSDGEPDFEAMNAGIDRVDLPEDGQVVDFTNVVTTFLSQYFLKSTGWIDMVYYRDAPLVVEALLNYFLIRNVVPEYEEDVRAALAVAQQAKIELPLCKQISNGWPSRFDKACSLIYGGEWFGFLEGPWQDYKTLVESMGMDMVTAKRIVQSLIGPDVELESVTVSPREFMDLEIVRVEMPPELESMVVTPEGSEMSSELPAEDEAELVAMVDKMLLGGSKMGDMSSPGSQEGDKDRESTETATSESLIPIPLFANVYFAEWDPALPREEQKPVEERRKIHVYFDPAIASKMLLGMRVSTYVYTLSNGMSYMEQASVYPTYYLEADEIEETSEEWEE